MSFFINTYRALRIMTLVFAALVFFPGGSSAQETGTVQYRVTAVKKGDTTVYSQSNIAEVIPSLLIYIPNSFTPNNDGLNDTFSAKGEGIVSFSLRIYNRWGEMLFESTDLQKAWDGKVNGQLCQQDAYIYQIVAKGHNKEIVRKSGTVTLIIN